MITIKARKYISEWLNFTNPTNVGNWIGYTNYQVVHNFGNASVNFKADSYKVGEGSEVNYIHVPDYWNWWYSTGSDHQSRGYFATYTPNQVAVTLYTTDTGQGGTSKVRFTVESA